jgi:hypothetical protein
MGGRGLTVVRAGVEPGGGGVGHVDLHIEVEGLDLELQGCRYTPGFLERLVEWRKYGRDASLCRGHSLIFLL